MHSQHATQCTTSANMHRHKGEGYFPEEKKSFTRMQIKPKNFIRAKTENDLYNRGENTINPSFDKGIKLYYMSKLYYMRKDILTLKF